ncbi:MAG: transcriptional regulator [Bacteroidota bacterium]|nr:transcriptional regulator [Bacteroidota bacterium]
MDIKEIITETDYQKAMQRPEIIFDAKLGSEEGNELQLLGALIDEYEKIHSPITNPN